MGHMRVVIVVLNVGHVVVPNTPRTRSGEPKDTNGNYDDWTSSSVTIRIFSENVDTYISQYQCRLVRQCYSIYIRRVYKRISTLSKVNT
jgi:hypothetical protein